MIERACCFETKNFHPYRINDFVIGLTTICGTFSADLLFWNEKFLSYRINDIVIGLTMMVWDILRWPVCRPLSWAGVRSGGIWRTRSDSAEHTLGSTENIMNMVIFIIYLPTWLCLAVCQSLQNILVVRGFFPQLRFSRHLHLLSHWGIWFNVNRTMLDYCPPTFTVRVRIPPRKELFLSHCLAS